HRKRCRSIIIEDDFFPDEPFEIDNEVPALSRGGDETASEGFRIEWLIGGCVHRPRQEPALRPDHHEVRAWLVGGISFTVEGDAVRTPIIHIELQVQESGLASVEDA